jgi:hypothetical protein
VPSRQETLLREIESDLLNGRPLADLLREIIILGGKAGSAKLRDWASLELNGYGEEGPAIPPYRGVRASIQLDGMSGRFRFKGQTISSAELPDFTKDKIREFVEFPMAVAELEAMAKSSRDSSEPIRISLPMAADLARYMNAQNTRPFQTVELLYWAVSPVAVLGIVDRIRTKLAELVSELLAGMSPEQETPTPAQANAAVNFVVTGRRSTVTVTNSQAAGDRSAATVQGSADVPAPRESSWWSAGRKIGAFIVGCAVIVGAVVTLLAYRR